MAFQTIQRRIGVTRSRSSTVTVAWRHSGHGFFRLAVNIGAGVARTLGWERGKRTMAAAYCPDTNRLRIAPGAGDTQEWSAGDRDGTATLILPLDHMTLRDVKPAQSVPFTVEKDRVLIVSLPPWTWIEGKRLAAEAAAAAARRFRGATPTERAA